MQKLPLQHKKIIITRPKTADESWLHELENFGAIPICIPLIKIELADSEDFKHKLQQLENYNWLIFTSANAVKSVFQQLLKLNINIGKLSKLKIAVVGSSTAKILQNLSAGKAGFGPLPIHFQPKNFTAISLAKEIPINKNDKIFLPQANISMPQLKEILEQRAAIVDAVTAYYTKPNGQGREELLKELQNGADAITFISPSAADVYHSFTQNTGVTLPQIHKISIGPSTSAALQRLGYTVAIEANPHTTNGVTAALIQLFSND